MQKPSSGTLFGVTIVVFALVLSVTGLVKGKWLSGSGPATPQFGGTSTESEFNRDVVATLVALRQLHAEIALDSVAHVDEKCNFTDNIHDAKVTRWASTLA